MAFYLINIFLDPTAGILIKISWNKNTSFRYEMNKKNQTYQPDARSIVNILNKGAITTAVCPRKRIHTSH